MSAASLGSATPRREVVVVATGVANTASVVAALRRAGATALVTADRDAIARAQRLVLPGVGAFGTAACALGATGSADVLRARVRAGVPFLAICLGMQLCFEARDEHDGVAGLSLFRGRAVRLDATAARVPKLGWDRIDADPSCEVVRSEFVCFAHSFAIPQPPPGWSVAWSSHGSRYVAALERRSQLLCQFHPELSGRSGRTLLERWLERSELSPW